MHELITVIIVTYDSRQFIDGCLESLSAGADGGPLQIIVVDNNSPDGTAEHVRRAHPDLELLCLDANVGFAAGNNAARQRTTGEWICFLTPDVEVHPGAFTILQAHLRDNPDMAAVGPRLVRTDGTLEPACKRNIPTIWSSFCRFSRLDRMFDGSRLTGGYHLRGVPDDAVAETGCVSGAFFFARRSALDLVDWFDPDYFLYGDDLDLCHRLRTAGYSIGYVGSATALHHGGKSFTANPTRSVDEFFRSMALFLEKHYRDRYPWPVRLGVHASIRVLWFLKRLSLTFGLTGRAAP